MGLVASEDTEQAHHREDKETVKKWNSCFFCSYLLFFFFIFSGWSGKKRGAGGAERERDIHNAFKSSWLNRCWWGVSMAFKGGA